MFDLRPVAHPLGMILAVMGAAMLLPMLVDLWHDDPHWIVFLQCAVMTTGLGAMVAVATRGNDRSLKIQQAFLLTSSLWAILPVFGAFPFILGQPQVSFLDAYFEAMSGMTTTGTTAFPNWMPYPRARICGARCCNGWEG